MLVSDWINLAIAVATLLSVVYIARQTSDTRKQATGQFLFELDSQFARYADLHSKLIDVDDATYSPKSSDWPIIWSYLGLFERCKVLIDNHTIDMKTFDAFFGYRLYSLVANYPINTSIEHSYRRYQYFIQLCNDLLKYKKARGLDTDDRAFAEHIKNFKLLPEPVANWRAPYEADSTWRTTS